MTADHGPARDAEADELVRTLEALRDSEERYRELFENANDMVYTHDLSGRLTSINRAGERLTGYSRDEALRLTARRLVDPADLRGPARDARPQAEAARRASPTS